VYASEGAERRLHVNEIDSNRERWVSVYTVGGGGGMSKS
jgi:hypothetical protein